AEVRHVRRLAHRATDPVTDEVLHDSVAALAVRILLDRVPDVADPPTQACGGDPAPHRLLADSHQLVDVVGHFSDRQRQGGIPVPTVHDRPAVDRDDVAVHDDPLPGYAVHHLVVHRDTDGAGESVVSLEVRDGPGVTD